jgi:outer membrane lipoprotein-sorting protein
MITRRQVVGGLGALMGLALVRPFEAFAALTTDEQSEIARIEQYMNRITTVKARFQQQSSNGGSASGTFYLQRPGKLRIDYDKPAHLQIYGSSGLLIYVDTELEESTYVPLSRTPAGLLVQENIRLVGGDVTVTKLERGQQVVRVQLVQTKEPDAGHATLAFTDQPLELKQWAVADARNTVTTVTLLDSQFGARIDPKVFVFLDPKFGRNREQ